MKPKTKRISKTQAFKMALVIGVVFNVNTGYVTAKPGMSKVYWAPLNAITAQPEPTTTYGTAGATAATTGSWTFAAEGGFTTNGFIDLKNDLLKGSKLSYSQEGDLSSPSETSKLNFDVVGLTAEIMERFRDMAGVPGVLLVKTPDCGGTEYWVVGCSCAPAFLKPNFDSDELGGSKGKKWSLEAMAHCSPYKWTGTLPLKAV